MCALVTGVQTCALPIFKLKAVARHRGKQQSDIDLAAPKRGWLRRARHLEQLQFHGRALLAMRSEDGRECRSGCALADAEPHLAAATGRDRSCRLSPPVNRRHDSLRSPLHCSPHLRELTAPTAASAQFVANSLFTNTNH